MGRYILDEKIEEVRFASDIVSVIGQYVPLKRSGRNFLARCPFHREKTPSFNVSPDKQIYKCFGCGEAGNVFSFLMKHERLTFPQAVELLAERAGIELGKARVGGDGGPGGRRERLREVNVWAARRFRKWLHAVEGAGAREYLERRDIGEETIRRFGLGWAPDEWEALLGCARGEAITEKDLADAGLVIPREDGSGFYDRFRGRLMFPIIGGSGEVMAFGGRTLGEATPKYINSPETRLFSKGRSLYGLYHAKGALRRDRRVLVVEGYTDCLALAQAGVENVVATLGTALTIDHLRLLRRYADEVIVIFDGDEPGQRAAERVLELFVREDVEVLVALMPAGEDPCDFVRERGVEAFKEAVGKAVSALDFRLRRALEDAGEMSITEKRRAVGEIVRVLAQGGDELKRTLMIQRVALVAGLPAEALARDARGAWRHGGAGGGQGGDAGEGLGVPGPEKELLQAVLADAALFEVVLRDGPEPGSFDHGEARALYEAMLEHHRIHGGFSTAEFLAGIAEPEAAAFAARLVFDEGRFKAREALRSSIAAFGDRDLDRRVERTQTAIKAANDAGDQEELKRLMARYTSELRDRARRRSRQMWPVSG